MRISDWSSDVCSSDLLAGAVRAHGAAREHGIRLVVGARLVLEDGFETLCLPGDRAAYARLTRLLTRGNRRAPKAQCRLTIDDVLAHGDGQVFLAMPSQDQVGSHAAGLAQLAGARPVSFHPPATLPYPYGNTQCRKRGC